MLLRSFSSEQGYDPQLEKLAMRWLHKRATTKYFRAVAGDLNDIRNDPRLQATGVSHPRSGLLQAEELAAYVLGSDSPQIVDDYMLLETTRTRASPQILRDFTATLIHMGFVSAGQSAEGHEHRWVRDSAIIDVFIPRGTGERSSSRPGSTGSTTIEAPAIQTTIDRAETVELSTRGSRGNIV